MKKYLELFYFGFYYFEWKAMQNFNKITRPIYGNLLLAIIYIIPYWEKIGKERIYARRTCGRNSNTW